jgi:hypothetical protein
MAPVRGTDRVRFSTVVRRIACIVFIGAGASDVASAQEPAPPITPTVPPAQSPVTSTTPVASPPNAAAATATGAPHDWTTWRPSAPATRISSAEAPKIDADPNDPVWQKAPPIEEFYQLEPDTGRPGSERTVVRVLYDEKNLYVLFYNYDSNPAGVMGTVKARDGNSDGGDFVRLYLDPGMTRRNGYAFVLNPLGMRVDILIKNNTDYLVDWDTLWDGKAGRVADGWVAEYRIPFRSISYDASRSDWGFDLSRFIRRKNERIRWSSISPTIPSVDISRSGTLMGVSNLERDIGLEIQLYGSVRYKHEWQMPTDDDVKVVYSGNAYYRITPSLTGTLTINPDFSDTPLDERRINTTRFQLFVPESRDFFLQDAGSFEFGGWAFVNDPNGQSFFSRNVGLINGVPVPIIGGGKVSGEYGGFNIGAFSAVTASTNSFDQQVLSVIRVTHPVFSESKVGAIITNGDPTGLTKATTAGADFQYRDSALFGDKIFQADVSYQRSFNDTFGDGSLTALAIQFPNEPWGGNFRFKEIDENFFPMLGFINRPGIRNYHPAFWYRPRFQDSWMRWLEIGMANDTVTDLGDELESMDTVPWIGVMTSDQGDLGFLNFHFQYENVPAPFSFGGNAVVPAGKYHWFAVEPYLQTSLGRPIQLEMSIYCCDFYNGKILNADFILNWRPNGTFEIIPRYTVALIDLPSGSVNIHVVSLRANVNFTPDMQLSAQAQYDNQSQNFGLSLRYRWEYEPGNQLFAAIGESSMIDGKFWKPHYESITSQASIRIGHTLLY